MRDELRPGATVKAGERYGSLVAIEGDEQNPIGVVMLDSGKIINCKLESLQVVKFSSDLRTEIAALRAEVAALHKVVIDAMAAASEAPGRTEAYEAVIAILDTAPEPSDETIAAIEAQANE